MTRPNFPPMLVVPCAFRCRSTWDEAQHKVRNPKTSPVWMSCSEHVFTTRVSAKSTFLMFAKQVVLAGICIEMAFTTKRYMTPQGRCSHGGWQGHTSFTTFRFGTPTVRARINRSSAWYQLWGSCSSMDTNTFDVGIGRHRLGHQ